MNTWHTAASYTTQYSGSFTYTNNTLSSIATPAGRLVPVLHNGQVHWKTEYNLTDHLGNVRVVFAAHANGQPEVMQQTSYYPFGYTLQQNDFSAGITSENKNLYNGKELQNDVLAGSKLDWYDYGARFYDPVVGRFRTQDAYSEKYNNLTPYQYAANNPIVFIDINGDSLMLFKNGAYITTVDNGSDEITGFNQESKTDKDGNEVFTGGQSFDFNDIDLDKESLKKGELTLSFMSDSKVKSIVNESGANDQNPLSAWYYAATESNAGKLDFYTYLDNRKFYIIGNVGYNTHDAGNFLWGYAMNRMGFGYVTARAAAHLNAWWSGKESNGESVSYRTHPWYQRAYMNRTWSGDSHADQRAIQAGYDACTLLDNLDATIKL